MNVPGAVEMQLSNEDRFGSGAWVPYQPNLWWTLEGAGQRVKSYAVYGWFKDATGALVCGGTLRGEITYDPAPPSATLSIKEVIGGTTTGSSADVTVWITATDQPGGSGVAQMQVGTVETFESASWQPFRATVRMGAVPGDMVYARVRDGAGNTSDVVATVVPEPGTVVTYSHYIPAVMRP